jgi:Mor family transcriptional regulator
MDTIRVDLSQLTIGDLRLFDKFQGGDVSNAALVDFLDRIVVGGASHLPLTALSDVMQAVKAEVERQANPKAGG